MHPETRVVGMEDSSSLQASQDEFENMVRNLDVKSRIMDQYADWKGVRYRLGGSTKTGMENMDHASPSAEISFPYGFPKPGDYRIFVQVKREGKVETVEFVAKAE